MATVTIDLIDGGRVIETKDGLEATRTAVVSGLEGDASARQYAALMLPQMPKRGDAHPSIPGIVLDTRDVTPISNSSGMVTVVLTYRNVDPSELVGAVAQIEVGAALVSETTSRDATGAQILITTEVPQLDSNGNQTGVKQETQVQSVQKQVPMMTLRYRRKEEQDPARTAIAYTGTVGWWVPQEASTSPQWMCTSIEGTTSDGGVTWDVVYTFQFARDGWGAKIDAIDPATGQPYIGAQPLVVGLYQLADFGALGLPDPAALTPYNA